MSLQDDGLEGRGENQPQYEIDTKLWPPTT